MRRTANIVVVVAQLLALVACSGGSAYPPVGTGTNGDGGVEASTLPHVDSASGGDGGEVSDAGGAKVDGGSGDGASDGASRDAGGPTLPAPGSSCRLAADWPTLAGVASVSSAGFDHFGAVSPDELTVVWMSAAGALNVADRTLVSAAFAPPETIDTSASPIATGRVALRHDGNGIVATRADGATFVLFERGARGSPRARSTAPDPVVDLDALVSESGGELSEPVLGNDGSSFFYLLATGGNVATMHESKWDAVKRRWTAPVALTNPEIQTTDAAHRRRPTGTAVDGRTLFFFDEVVGTEQAAWRDTPSSTFNFFRDIGSRAEATPNAKCAVLYIGDDDPDAGIVGLATAR
jgi:hypothetical protein